MRKRQFLTCSTLPLAGLLGMPAWGQSYPTKPVRLIVTYPPGGSSDLMARILGQRLGESWGQTVVVENRPGASGSMGMEFAARQPADGYAFVMGNMGPAIVNPLLTKVPYELSKDFIPVSLVATAPSVLVVNAAAPYRTLQELLAAAKAKPKSMNFGSGGSGSLAHLAGEMLNRMAGVENVHIAYKGGIGAVNDVLANQIQMSIADVLPVVQHIKTGKMRALAVTSPKRIALLPDVPTFAESGLPDLVAVNWWGIYLPAGTPKAVVDPFHAALGKAMENPDLVRRYAELGVEAQHSSAEELRSFIASESAKYAKVIKENGIKGEQ